MFIIKEGTDPSRIGEGTEESTQGSIINWIKGKGYTVRSTEEDKSYLETNVQNEVNKMFAKQKVEIEEKVKELTGIDRTGEGERAIDYLTRAVNQKIGELPELQSKLKKFEEEGFKGNEQATEYKNQLEKLQSDYQTLKSEMDEKLAAKDKDIFLSKVRHQENSELSKLRPMFDQNIKSEYLDDIIQSRLSKFRNEKIPHQLEDQIVYKDTAGNTITSTQDGKPVSTNEVLMPYFKDIIDETRKAAGSGSNGVGGGASGEQGKTKLQKPDEVKTKVQLMSWLKSDAAGNLSEMTKEFSEAYSELGKDLPFR